ncbi:MAG: hypothetical protein MUE50_11335 [Pirellulaceae bacterium]|nr:hypothetical protein [Pirellulaceae bacterium]MCU0978087.1 hypothetical protein [Pirellulaceae bacterium]
MHVIRAGAFRGVGTPGTEIPDAQHAQFEMESLVRELVPNLGGISELRAYVAIQTAAQLSEPLSDADVERAADAVRAAGAEATGQV